MSDARPKTKRLPLPGYNLLLHFDCAPEDTELMMVAVCGVLHIAKGECVQTYDASTGKLTLLFHFTRQVNVDKASRRVEMMIKYFGSCSKDIEETPAEEMLPGVRYIEKFKDGTMRVRRLGDGLSNSHEQSPMYDATAMQKKMA